MNTIDHITLRKPKSGNINNQVEINKQNIEQLRTDKADITYVDNAIANIPAVDLTPINGKITALETKDTEIENQLNLVDDLTNTNKTDIDELKPKVEKNITDITNLTTSKLDKTLYDTLIVELRKYNPFDYKGDYQAGTTYKKNELVSDGDNLFLSKVDNNTEPTSNTTNWLLIEKPFTIDLSNYYTKPEIDTKLSDKLDTTTYNTDKANFAIKNESNEFTQDNTFNGKIKLTDKAEIKLDGDKTLIHAMSDDIRVIAPNNKSLEMEAGRILIKSNSNTLPVRIESGNSIELAGTTNVNGDLKGTKAFFGKNIDDANNRQIFTMDVFRYSNNDYVVNKWIKGNANLGQIEANLTTNTFNISAPAASGGFWIEHLSAPKLDTHAANKKYVDDSIANLPQAPQGGLSLNKELTLTTAQLNTLDVVIDKTLITDDEWNNTKIGYIETTDNNGKKGKISILIMSENVNNQYVFSTSTDLNFLTNTTLKLMLYK